MSTFGEDKSEPHINMKSLENELNLSQDQKNKLQEVEEMRETLKEEEKKVKEKREDPDNILYNNIQRANNLLDDIQRSISNGNNEPRMFEVASQLINAITSASTSIVNVDQHDDEMEYKQKWLEYKEKELAVKQALKGSDGSKKGLDEGSQYQQNNLIFTDRESLMQFIKEQEKNEGVSNQENEN